jgi:transcriptional regulator with XRE-family HTH domain
MINERYLSIMNDFNAETGKRIKHQRLKQGMTRDELAHKAGISGKFLYEIEIGKKGMSAETLYKVAKVLDVTTDWMLGV